MFQAFHEDAPRLDRDGRDRDMPGLLLDIRRRLKQVEADRQELAALRHSSAHHQQQYQHLASQHEQVQESAVVLEARLAAAQAATAAEEALLKEMVPALVLQCAAILSAEQLLPGQPQAAQHQQEQQLSAEQLARLALQGGPVADGSAATSPLGQINRHASSSNGSDRVLMVRTPGQSDKGIHALSAAAATATAAAAGAHANAATAAAAEEDMQWGACTSAVANALTGTLAEPLKSPTAPVDAAAAATAAAATDSPVPTAAAETAAAASAIQQVLLVMSGEPDSSTDSSGCISPSGSSHSSLLAKLFGCQPVPAAAASAPAAAAFPLAASAAGRAGVSSSMPASEATAEVGQAATGTQSLSAWSDAWDAANPKASASVSHAEHPSAVTAAAHPSAATGWSKHRFHELLGTDTADDSSSSSCRSHSSVCDCKAAVAAASPVAAAAAAVSTTQPFSIWPQDAHCYTVHTNPLAVSDGECDWPVRGQHSCSCGGSAGNGGFSGISGSFVRRATTSRLAQQQEMEALQKEVDAAALSSQLTRLAGRITTRLGQDEFGSCCCSSQPTSQQLLAEVLPMLWGMKAMLTEGKL